MNFLAHAFLAGDDAALVVGGVVGDWIKGPLPGNLPPDLARGVALHRAIDSWADTHPCFQQSRSRVSTGRRRYAGVLVDMFYDHLLAREWGRFHHESLSTYCCGVYSAISGRRADLPGDSHAALARMAEQDWLGSYASVEGIGDVLARMSRRARRPNPLAGGEKEMLADTTGFESDFRDWLPDAQAFVRSWHAESGT